MALQSPAQIPWHDRRGSHVWYAWRTCIRLMEKKVDQREKLILLLNHMVTSRGGHMANGAPVSEVSSGTHMSQTYEMVAWDPYEEIAAHAHMIPSDGWTATTASVLEFTGCSCQQ
ncbi:hypothetical protein SAY86_029598 [Trapa natans]|uniref:Uncharacterized protein n=1 Tax=Trapa natans TaxID=22666 RepID=A0AAN7MER3_TRANT|nr:hypothetical protein SAY86_029598 [Trapa natans]